MPSQIKAGLGLRTLREDPLVGRSTPLDPWRLTFKVSEVAFTVANLGIAHRARPRPANTHLEVPSILFTSLPLLGNDSRDRWWLSQGEADNGWSPDTEYLMTTTVNTTPNPKTKPESLSPESNGNTTATIRLALFAFNHAHRVFLDTAAQQLGVGTTDLDALLQLAQDEPVTPGQLRAHLQLTTGAITAVTDRLDAAGYLTRLQHPTDRRSLLLVLTPTGRNAVHDVLTRYDALITTLPDAAMTLRHLKSLADVVLQASSDDFS